MAHWTKYMMSGIFALSSVAAATNIPTFQQAISQLEQSVEQAETFEQEKVAMIDYHKQAGIKENTDKLNKELEKLKYVKKKAESHLLLGKVLNYTLWGIALGGPVAAFFTFPRRKKSKEE